MAEPLNIVTLDQMKGPVGSLLFLWSDLERSLHAALRTDLFAEKNTSVHQISRALSVWSEGVMHAGVDRPLQTELCQRLTGLLKQALVVRNLVCHGLTGYSAQVFHRSHEAHLCVELGGDKQVLTWGELQTMFVWMSRSRGLIDDLTEAALQKDAAVSEASLRGWNGFPEQS